MKKRTMYYVELDYGCGLHSATTLESARRSVTREEGTANVRLVREATKDDVDHVRAMGGFVPDDAIIAASIKSP